MEKAVLTILSTFELYNYLNAVKCVDHYNKEVDWYVIYKLPQQSSDNYLINTGRAYTYMTSNDANKWILSDIPIDSRHSLVGQTLKNMYCKSSLKRRYYKTQLSILYNDQPPDGRRKRNARNGHAKGVILGDKSGGIWLIHTVPRFPQANRAKYFYPKSGFRNGQNFLCISLNISNLNLVGTQLTYNQINIYSNYIPENLMPQLPNFINLTTGKINSRFYHHLATLKSFKGQKFISFAKSSKFGKDLYADLVAPFLKADLLVETWPNTRDRLPSDCTKPYKVYNVASIRIDEADIYFSSKKDHSKWAIATKNTGKKWICIGDINRGKRQTSRGGGTVCFSKSGVVKAFQKCITDIEPCYSVKFLNCSAKFPKTQLL